MGVYSFIARRSTAWQNYGIAAIANSDAIPARLGLSFHALDVAYGCETTVSLCESIFVSVPLIVPSIIIYQVQSQE